MELALSESELGLGATYKRSKSQSDQASLVEIVRLAHSLMIEIQNTAIFTVKIVRK